MRLEWKAASLALILAVALIGCASPKDAAESSYREPGPAAPLHTAGRQPGAKRAVMRSGSLDIEVSDLGKAETAMKEAVAHAGGYLYHEDGTNLASESPALYVVVRVPETTFEATMTGFAALGRCSAKSIEASDLTEQILDMQAQIKLGKRSLQDNLSELQMQAKMSTIELTIVQKPNPDAVAASNVNWCGDTLNRALSSAIGAFRAVGALLIWVVVYSPFWLPVMGMIWWMGRGARRRIAVRSTSQALH